VEGVLIGTLAGVIHDGVGFGELPGGGDVEDGVLGGCGNAVNNVGEKAIYLVTVSNRET
jgi:hypothetical protein